MRSTEALNLVPKIWRKSPGDYFCISTKSPTRRWKDNFFKRYETRKAIDFIKTHKDCDLYLCPHGFSKPRRHKDFAIDPYVLYADLDECDPNRIDIKPTIAFESSPGRYVGFWICDEPVSEELNRRLSYYVGADNSGWDRTQVLRVPGTINHKPEYKKPRVKVLWDNGPYYETQRLEKVIPQIETEANQVEGGDATEIYKKYQKHLPRWLRKELIDPQVTQGKRSEVLWKIINGLLETGMDEEETFTVAWHSAWNKHADRRDGERQLRREIDKATGRHIGGSAKKSKKKPRNIMDTEEPERGTFFNIVPMSKVAEQNIQWLVPHMIARGETTMVEGDPGVGKSYLLMWLAAQFCDGKRLPWLE